MDTSRESFTKSADGNDLVIVIIWTVSRRAGRGDSSRAEGLSKTSGILDGISYRS